ncbi:MAG: hypothetical protein ACI8UO_002318 [Verrucomicrobiales bacterium]|jgi:hypothetical protein
MSMPIDDSGIGRLGVEIELLAPPGRSREDLANAIAKHYGGNVRRFFHPQGEPSKAKNTPFFENLTLGFIVDDDEGNIFAWCVDDLTIQEDLDQKQPSQPGWYRIVSDDARLLRLTMCHADATEPRESVLLPIADLFCTEAKVGEGGMIRVSDEAGAPIAIAAPLPGERERPCELITPPIDSDHLEYLETLLGLARSLDFSVPAEAATHLHFDAASLCDAATIANLVRFLNAHSDALKEMIGTNPRCRRLGKWPAELIELVESQDFVESDWESARKQLSQVKLTKYCDFNLINLVHQNPDKHTFEVRILPVWLDGRKTFEAATLFAKILNWAKENDRQLKSVPSDLTDFAFEA